MLRLDTEIDFYRCYTKKETRIEALKQIYKDKGQPELKSLASELNRQGYTAPIKGDKLITVQHLYYLREKGLF